MTTPYEQARNVYAKEGGPRTFEEDVLAHCLHGFVFATPDYFAMGRAVDSSADPADILNPSRIFPEWTADCWHVYLFSGDMAKAWDILPYPLPMFSLERKGELRFYRFEDIARHSQPVPA